MRRQKSRCRGIGGRHGGFDRYVGREKVARVSVDQVGWVTSSDDVEYGARLSILLSVRTVACYARDSVLRPCCRKILVFRGF